MIVIKDLNAMEQISIRTRNSEYQFQVIEPAEQRGFLSGGPFGDEQYEAVLVGALVGNELRGRLSAKLEIGACALFYIRAKERVKRLTTSMITSLKVRCDVI
jgi:hypothetical protein